MPSEPIRVGIAGLGRSGWNLHAHTLGQHDAYRIAAVADPVPERREEAVRRHGCRAYVEPAELFADPGVEVVTLATPSHTHAPLAVAALTAGRHVVVEKPAAQTVAEMDAMIAAAEGADRVLTVFQPLRLEAAFVAIREVIGSGRLGQVVLVRRVLSSFGRRADWQMLRRFGGGELSNNGPHAIDQALLLLGEGPVEVFADLRHTVGAGDAEDHVKLCLKGSGGLLADIEVSRCDAFPPPEWSVLGTAGGLQGGSRELRLRWLDPADLVPLRVDEGPAPGRRYGTGEQLPWHEDVLRPRQERTPYALFYDHLAATLREGAPLLVTPASVRRQVEVIERAREMTGAR